MGSATSRRHEGGCSGRRLLWSHDARGASARVPAGAGAGVNGDYQLYLNSNFFWLAGAEGNDAPDRIVRRDADGHAIPRYDLDAEAAHAAAELSQHFMAGVALHTV